jgi:hypothetical protein
MAIYLLEEASSQRDTQTLEVLTQLLRHQEESQHAIQEIQSELAQVCITT